MTVSIAVAVVALALAWSGAGASARAGQSGGVTANLAADGGYPMVPASLPAATSSAAPTIAARNITTVGSLNWAGYAVSRRHTTFLTVRATFFVPYLTCAKVAGGTFSSHWVGFDGFVSGAHSVEQIGIAADCSAKGKPSYSAWFEMFPLPASRARIGVRAGDSVTASVSYDAAHKDFELALTDNTDGQHFAVGRRCPDVKVGRQRLSCPRSSAEVISEAPATGTIQHPVIAHLSDYGAVSFEDIVITDTSGHKGGLVSGHWDTTKIVQMGSSVTVLALPTPTQAATFDTYWQAAG